MHYDSVLVFVRKVLENSHIPTKIFEEPFHDIEAIDYGLRESLYGDFDKEAAFARFSSRCQPDTLYYFTDSFYCSYAAMLLPDSRKRQYFVIGPFTYIDINPRNYLELLEKLDIPAKLLPLLENYYYNIAFIDSEARFKNLIGTLAAAIWPGKDAYSQCNINGNPWNIPYTDNYISDEDILLVPVNIKATEARYAFESQCMQVISQGNYTAVDQLLSCDGSIRPIPRLTDSLRDYKNYMVVFNTLLRKAAEQGFVHPVYLDQISSRFARQIESLTSIASPALEREMLHKYCMLVRNYSVKGYSPIIQKAINQIHLNLTSDLSLKALSEMFHISAGYLSTLFRKETGMTLTDYVNKKRVEHAILLLNATDLQIQTIASYCGINDLNHFTRMFKKFHGMTPKKYKELISKSPVPVVS